MGSKPLLYPQPAVLIGANVNDKPTWTAISFCGMGNYSPTVLTISLGKGHYINEGIKQNKTFSVNVPSVELLKKFDYCGSHSGKKTDKSKVFEAMYGDLKTAPMASECPISMECKLIQTIELTKDEMFIGEVVQTYISENVMSDNLPDILKIKPIVFNDNAYWGIGTKLGKAWDIGRTL